VASADRVSELVAYFEEQILSGQLAPGALLPSERAISLERGVSRSVVREAISRLASMGLVRSIHGSGTRVQAPTGQPIVRTLQQLLRQGEVQLTQIAEVRLPLETAIARSAALHRNDDHLHRLEVAQQHLADPSASLESQVAADLQFHVVLAEASGNPLFGLVLGPIQHLLIESRRRTLGRHGSQLAHAHHAAILEAVRRRDPLAAESAMRRHLEANFQHLVAESAPTDELESS